jgi:hypothetical protein
MAQPKFTLYKYIKLDDGSWRYKKAAFYSNGKIKPKVVIVKNPQGKAREELHAEGRYYMNHSGAWLDAGADALLAQRQPSTLLDQVEIRRLRAIDSPQEASNLPAIGGRLTLAAAAEKYLSNCEKRGLDAKSIVPGLLRCLA